MNINYKTNSNLINLSISIFIFFLINIKISKNIFISMDIGDFFKESGDKQLILNQLKESLKIEIILFILSFICFIFNIIVFVKNKRNKYLN